MGNYRVVSLTLIPGKVLEQLILETTSRQMKDRKIRGWENHQVRSTWIHQGEVTLDHPSMMANPDG